MKLRKVVGAFLLIVLLMCGCALADNTLETYNALGIGAMPCQGTAKVIVFRVIFAEDGKQPDGNVIEWTNTYSGDVREAERLFFDPTLKNVVDSPNTYSRDYDSLRSFYYRSSYGKLDVTGDAYVYLAQHEAQYYTDYHTLVDEVLTQCEWYIDWSQYDSNQDGYVDGIYICPTTVPNWEMSDRMNFVSYTVANTVNNMNVTRCAYITPKAYIDSTNAISTIAHETFHLMGITDIYQGTGLNPMGLRAKSVMDQGLGDLPEICKHFLGWMDAPQVLAGEGEWEIELSSISVTDDWLIVYPLGNSDSDVIFVVDYVTNEANNQEPVFVNAEPHHGVRIWQVDLNGNNTASGPDDFIMPFDYIEAASLPGPFSECFYQPGDSFTPWTTPSSDYAISYEYTTTGLLEGSLNRLCYIAEHAYSGVYIDILSMDGKTAKLRVKIEPVLDLTGSEATVEVIDPKTNGIFLDQNDYFTFATVSCPYNMAVNGQIYVRHATGGVEIPVSHILSDDGRRIRLMIAKADLPQIQLNQEYKLQLHGLITAFNGDELSFGEFDNTIVFEDIPISLTRDDVLYPYGLAQGDGRSFYRSEKEICFFRFDRDTKESYLNILNIETKEETAVRLDAYEPIQERWSATNRYFPKKDEGYFNIWQIDRDHFAISFQPLMDWTKQIVVMYDFDGHLLDVMEVYGASRCIGQLGERYLVDDQAVFCIVIEDGKLALSEALDIPFDVQQEIYRVNNVNMLADETYSVTLWLVPEGAESTAEADPVQYIYKNGQKVATIPDAGLFESLIRVGKEAYLFKLTDMKLMLDIFDEQGQLKRQLTLYENLPIEMHADHAPLFVAHYADDMLYVSFSTYSDLYDRSAYTTYLIAFDMDFNLKYYFHSENVCLEYGTPFYIDEDVFFYTQDNYLYRHLYLEQCNNDSKHIQTKKYGKPASETECGWTDGIVCGLCGKVIVAPQPIAHPKCSTLRGDANDDGVVDAFDALLILQSVAGWDVEVCSMNADSNEDGTVTIEDALQTLKVCFAGDMTKAVRALQAMMRNMYISQLQIVEQPTDQYTMVGQQAKFSVSATGDALNYQWYINRNDGKGWVAIMNATEAAYTTTAVTKENAGYQYRCVVMDVYGNESTSAAAMLHVEYELPVTGDEGVPVLWLALTMIAVLGMVYLRRTSTVK